MSGSDDGYTLREVAELLGMSRRTLQRRLAAGAFPHRRLVQGRYGLEIRIPPEDVDAMRAPLVRETRALVRGPRSDAQLRPLRSAPRGADADELLTLLRGLLATRDAEMAELREQLTSVQRVLEDLQRGVARLVETSRALPHVGERASDDAGAELVRTVDAMLEKLRQR